nr:hypothetical protein GCM10020092_086870 [Actinoplanes digitatis]
MPVPNVSSPSSSDGSSVRRRFSETPEMSVADGSVPPGWRGGRSGPSLLGGSGARVGSTPSAAEPRRGGRIDGGVEAGHDLGPLGVDVALVAAGAGAGPGRGRGGVGAAGQLVEVLAGGVEVGAVDVEPVRGASGERGGAQDGVEVGGRLQVCGDAAGRQHVEQVLTHARIDVARDRIVGRVESVVPPPATGATR